MTAKRAIYLRCDAPDCGELSPFDTSPWAFARVVNRAKTLGWHVDRRGDVLQPRDYCPRHARFGKEVRGRARGKGCNDATSVDGVAVDYGRSGSSMRRSRRR